MAVGRRTDDDLGADIAGSARPILNEQWLAKPLRQPLTDKARQNVARTTGGKADDDADRPRRIGLRPSGARYDRERGSTRGQMQKLSAWKSHNVPPRMPVARSRAG